MAYGTGEEQTATDDTSVELAWEERELLVGLKRLAGARAQMAVAEAELVVAADRQRDLAALARPQLDHADEAHLLDVHEQLVSARVRAAGRLRRSARERVAELEATEMLVCDRLGFVSWEDYEAFVANGRCRPGVEDAEIDLAYVEFARAELRAAEHAWAELNAAVRAAA